ncbi:sugar phosphate nucleotidyltransferase [Sphingobacterium thalpophilum]|uniref:sugar phosphate nucleotidyltransferase n=1 Tax=Sphingobacterium thalpophilum TaxID=259 RepID=UPI003D96623F
MTNAIILAAGKGGRLLPLTEKVPKPLLSIWGDSIIERQIRFLVEAGVNHITIVVGYLYEQFLFLTDKYPDLEIVINSQYEATNNFYSLFLVRNRLKNTWIIEGDIFMVSNLFLTHNRSVYYSSLKPVVQYEWYFKYNIHRRIQSIHIADRLAFPAMFTTDYHINMGVSFWDHRSCSTIKNLFESIHSDSDRFDIYKNLYWDKIIYDYLNEFEVYIHIVKENDWYEIDSVKDMTRVIKALDSGNSSSQVDYMDADSRVKP